jgi:Fe(II)/alpha-ketoglutarate-dependent arginine beta-hydroxylase
MHNIVLTREELVSIRGILADITSQFASVEDEEFLRYATICSHELPRRIRLFLHDFKMTEPPSGVCLISGYPVESERIGSTPSHWNGATGSVRTLEEQVLFVLFASLLGEVFGWTTQQGGHVMHDVLPIREHETEQIGTGSTQEITWHNEDAFHPYRGDYVGLMCLRNPNRVATTFASLDSLDLDPKTIEILFEPRFFIRPDYSHSKDNVGKPNGASNHDAASIEAAFRNIQRITTRREKISVLFGDKKTAYIRIDPFFMDPLDDDAEAQSALNALISFIDGRLRDIVLQPGDFCFLDNYRAVHGRRSFKPSYNGSDRWLKRINVTRDLRKSRDARLETWSRTII